MAKEEKTDKPADEELRREEAEATPTTFKSKVNAYCFIHLPKKLRETWGVSKGTEHLVTIELTAEGLIIRKT